MDPETPGAPAAFDGGRRRGPVAEERVIRHAPPDRRGPGRSGSRPWAPRDDIEIGAGATISAPRCDLAAPSPARRLRAPSAPRSPIQRRRVLGRCRPHERSPGSCLTGASRRSSRRSRTLVSVKDRDRTDLAPHVGDCTRTTDGGRDRVADVRSHRVPEYEIPVRAISAPNLFVDSTRRPSIARSRCCRQTSRHSTAGHGGAPTRSGRSLACGAWKPPRTTPKRSTVAS